MPDASRGLTPKKPASNSLAPARNPPAPPRTDVMSKTRAKASQPRSVGSGEMPSRPSTTASHRDSASSMPPGYRQAIPTIAIGSRAAATRSAFSRRRFSFSFNDERSASTSSSDVAIPSPKRVGSSVDSTVRKRGIPRVTAAQRRKPRRTPFGHWFRAGGGPSGRRVGGSADGDGRLPLARGLDRLRRCGLAQPDLVVQPAKRRRRPPRGPAEQPHADRHEHAADQRRVDHDGETGAEAEHLQEAHPARAEGEEVHRDQHG